MIAASRATEIRIPISGKPNEGCIPNHATRSSKSGTIGARGGGSWLKYGRAQMVRPVGFVPTNIVGTIERVSCVQIPPPLLSARPTVLEQ